MWQGLLALKNDSAAVQMHFVGGNPGVAGDTLSRHHEQATPLLRIAQRMRLEPAQLDQVHRKMKVRNNSTDLTPNTSQYYLCYLNNTFTKNII